MTGTTAAVSRLSKPRHDRSIGIDLAADPINTAAVELSWDGDRATIVEVWGRGREKVDDHCLVKLLERSDAKIGVDCPFGWPGSFVALMRSEGRSQSIPFDAATPKERERLAYRDTDLFVMRQTERKDAAGERTRAAVRPLSVSADRIAHVAFRFAGLRSRLLVNRAARRDGADALVEVYPAAALALWEAPSCRQYKGKNGAAARRAVVDWLQGARVATGGKPLDLDRHVDALVASDHVLDALLCALIARDCDVRGPSIPPGYEDAALAEGWIHLPKPAAHVVPH